MIGNDIVDLVLARKESNWQRKGFLNKIFSYKEQLLIESASSPEIMVWNLWTRKEAAYKIYNRQTGKRGFFPLRLECNYVNDCSGSVSCDGFEYYTQTQIFNDFIYTIAVTKKQYFNKILKLNFQSKITKVHGLPFIFDEVDLILKPASITHHGCFWEGITLFNF